MDKMTLEERLNEQLSEKEQEIEELQNKIEALESKFDWDRQNWQLHSAFEEDAFSREMPFPRLEMRITRTSKDNWYSIEWTYGLVYKHYGDIGGKMLKFIPFGCTTGSGGTGTFDQWYKNGKLDLPFRDGVHIRSESLILNLPAYIICREKGIFHKIDLESDLIAGHLPKMRSSNI